jgi:putative two-component system response regulator
MRIPLEVAYKSPELFTNPLRYLHRDSRTLSTTLAAGKISKRMLIVDDEREITETLFNLLSVDLECETAGSAEEALARLRQREFRLVISDITMPGMSGLEMLPHLKQISPDAVVILISGLQTMESAIEAMRLGAFDYVMKPFDLRQVEAVVKRALTHHELIISKQRYEIRLEELVEQRTAELDHVLALVENAYPSTLKAQPSTLEKKDSEGHGNSQRVVTYSLRLGREYGLDSGLMKALEFGSLLHDIGMIGVPDAPPRKPAHLTEEEWVRIREHPMHAQQILRCIAFLKASSGVVAQYCEKWDGSGYPPGLCGEDIDICAQIFAVADAFDAITSDCAHRRGKSYEAAAEELDQCAGKLFDAKVIAAFHRVPKEDWAEFTADLPQSSEHDSQLRGAG